MQDARAAPRSYALRGRGGGSARPSRRVSAPSSSSSSKTLADAFKQHGAKLCDGSRLNAVGKGVDAVGSVPPALAASVSALYLSQNRLRGLAGVEQFQNVRLLSVGGNLLARFEELDRLAVLRHLRSLNLVGNPLCDQPNYRLRVLDRLRGLQVLDAADVTNKEREAAPVVTTQDRAMRATLVRNHAAIHKLQRAAQIIQLHRDLHGFVFTGAQLGRFDRVAGPHDVAVDVERFLRLWDLEEAFSAQARSALEQQLLVIVMRTYRKLSEHPKNRAKEYLAGLAGAKPPSASLQIDGVPAELHRQCSAWSEAYGSVISLQQQTIINLQGVCERNNRDAVELMKELLLADAPTRATIGRTVSRMCVCESKTVTSATRSTGADTRRDGLQDAPASAQLRLPPQQQDPDMLQHESVIAVACDGARPNIAGGSTEREHRVGTKRELSIRSGEFANRTLGEAIHRFTLREVTRMPPKSTRAAAALPAQRQRTNQVFTVHDHQEPKAMFAASPRKLGGDKLQTCGKQLEMPTSTTLYPVYSTHRRESHASTFDGEGSSRFDDESDVMSVATASDNTSMVWAPGDTSRDSNRRQNKSPHPNRRRQSFSRDPRRAQQLRPVPVRSPRHELSRFEDEEKSGEPAAVLPPPPPPPPQPAANLEPIANARLQELEQREEKYIKALMESEQRELELRNGICSLQKKLTYYQRSFRQDMEERQKIKQEVETRVMTVAGPKVLRRYFVRWVRFYSWALQVHHIRRKRAFIVQYDLFWQWRRAIWRKHQVRELSRRRCKRELWVLFGEWANAARLSVIATRSRAKQARRLLCHVVGLWRNAVEVSKFLYRKHEQSLHARSRQVARWCWSEWRRVVQQKRKLAELRLLRSRERSRSLQQLTLWKWKVFVLAVARPTQARADMLLERRVTQARARYFQAWRRVGRASKLQQSCLTRRVWRRWAASYLAAKRSREDEQSQYRIKLKHHFLAWRGTAVDALTSRRALALAKRYVNQRRLRKLWLHWKFFSITRRKYRQGSTKALKHYFMKLLRRSWRGWKAETSHNLQSLKRSKFRTLRQHFEAFTEGIRRAKRNRYQRRMAIHAVKRRRLKQVAQCVSAWRHHVTKRKWATQCGNVLRHQKDLLALGLAWRVWRTARVLQLVSRTRELQESKDKLVDEKNELEADLMVADDKILSVEGAKEALEMQCKDQTRRLEELEQSASAAKKQSTLERSEQLRAIANLEKRCREWEQRCSLEESKQLGVASQHQAMEKQKHELQDRIADLERTLAAEQRAREVAHDGRDQLREEMNGLKQQFASEMSVEVEKREARDQELGDLRLQLVQEQKEREETANRLQEYERRIATTCEAINQHEDEHERDKMRLRYEYAQLEAKWREEHARTSELQRLLTEKNELIRSLQTSLRSSSGRQHDIRGLHDPDEAADDHDSGDPTTKTARERSSGQSVPSNRHLAPSSAQADIVRDVPPVDLLLKEISNSPLLKPNETETANEPRVQRRETASGRRSETNEQTLRTQPPLYPRTHPTHIGRQSTRAAELVALEQERLIDARTSKVHDDIRLLQERITKRLEQGALSVSKLMACRQSVRHSGPAKLSISSSCTSLSEDDSSSAAESTSSFPRMKIRTVRKKTKSPAVSSHRSVDGIAAASSNSLRRRSGRENTGDLANAASGPRKAGSSRRSSSSTLVASARKKKSAR